MSNLANYQQSRIVDNDAEDTNDYAYPREALQNEANRTFLFAKSGKNFKGQKNEILKGDKQNLNRFRAVKNSNYEENNATFAGLEATGWGTRKSPTNKFKIELVNSKRNGIRGTLPRAFRHLSHISRPSLLSDATSPKQVLETDQSS